ncbi:nicotinamide n-methyltransferase [Boothiomyces sp. JEL0866]|nr:nicotinamide n-methyltransferase [Boothiomyces sp. JEL0866]
MIHSNEEELEFDNNMFAEPEDFRPPTPEPTTTTFRRNPEFVENGPLDMIVHLPAKHSLWAHKLWNAGQSLANYLDEHKNIYKNKNVLELGAAASLPSIICALNGAKKVVSTDYPDQPLIQNIILNAKANAKEQFDNETFIVRGYIWGQDEGELDEPLTKYGKFDLILLADLIFNHNQHANMLKTCKEMLSANGIVLMTYSHHVVHRASKDLVFFDVAKEFGFTCERLYEQKWDPMFPEDSGDLDVRSTVYGWKLYL